MKNPSQVYWEALIWVLRYLNDSLNGGLKYTKKTQEKDAFEGVVDANYAGNMDNKKSLSGFVLTLFETTISWKEN